MTSSPQRPCRHPGCSALVAIGGGSYCAKHLRGGRVIARARDRFRGTAHERGYDSRWREASRGFLQRYPLCPGVLVADLNVWSRALAIEFDRIRAELRQESGTLLLFSQETRAGLWLAQHPIYRVEPWEMGQAATVVDHIIPHKGNPELFWAEWNWQPLSKRAHDKKTAREPKARGVEATD